MRFLLTIFVLLISTRSFAASPCIYFGTLTKCLTTAGILFDNQKAARFSELTANGTDYVAIKAPASLAAPYTLTLPADDGTASQFLQTDGAGVLSWVSGGTVTDLQTAYDGGNTITDGTNSLDVLDGGTGLFLTMGSTASNAIFSDMSNNAVENVFLKQNASATGHSLRALMQGTAGSAAYLETTNAANADPLVWLINGGSGSNLVLEGSSTAARVQMLGSTSGTLGLTVPATVTSYTLTLPSDDGASGQVLRTDGAGVTTWVAQTAAPSIGGALTSATAGSVLFAGSGTFAQDNADLFWDNTSKNFGIGIGAPAFRLDVRSPINDNVGLLRVTTFNGTDAVNINSKAELTFSGASVNGSSDFFRVVPGDHTNAGNSRSFSVLANTPSISGSFATQQFSLFTQPAITSGAANTVTDASTLAISGAPKAAGSALITNSSGIRVSSAATVTAGVTNAYGLYVDAPTGATNNYAAIFLGGNVGIGTTAPADQLELTGNLRLPATTSTVGQIKQGATTVFHTFGTQNTFVGPSAGNFTLSGIDNTGVGYTSLDTLTTGSDNTAFGSFAGTAIIGGTSNTAIGRGALSSASSAGNNTAVGKNALSSVTTSSSSTGVGVGALQLATGTQNTALGRDAGATITSGTVNTFIGYAADATSGTLTNATAIGANASVSASNSLVLGSAVTVGIGTTAPATRLEVVGSTDIIQAQVRANATQTANVFNVETSGGTDLFTVQGDGAVVISETGGNGGNVPHALTRRTNTTVTSATCSVDCSAGEVVTGGGCSNTASVTLEDTFPTDNDTWSCGYTLATGDCTAYAMCFQY